MLKERARMNVSDNRDDKYRQDGAQNEMDGSSTTWPLSGRGGTGRSGKDGHRQ
jgi:hypothetical protein